MSFIINPYWVGVQLNFYVSDDGTGSGAFPDDPMSTTTFLALTLPASAHVFFKVDDTYI